MSSKSWRRSGAVSSIVVAVVRVMDVVLQLCFQAILGVGDAVDYNLGWIYLPPSKDAILTTRMTLDTY